MGFRTLFFITLISIPSSVAAQVRLTGNLAIGRFEQQVKTEIGGARGERLVDDTFVGLHLSGTYGLGDYVSLGAYLRGDLGFRSAGTFESFDAEGAPTITNETGGAYSELWLGPLVVGHYKILFAEVGYGLLGIRSDEGRDDLPGTEGEETSVLQTSPAIAWMVALGAGLPVNNYLQVNLRLEYRVRYYTRRGGEPLANDVAHGTQNLTPFFGVIWTL